MNEIAPDGPMPLWRVEEAAEYLGIRPKTLYEWVRTGRVPHRKLGFNVRFDPEELRGWANSGSPAQGRPPVEEAEANRMDGLAQEMEALVGEAARALRSLQAEIGANLSFPRRRELEELADRLDSASRCSKP